MEEFVVEPLPGFPTEIGHGLWTLQETRRRTLKYVDGIDQEALDHQPSGLRHSVATLLYHIAAFEVDWLYVDILGNGYDEDRGIPMCSPEVAAWLPYPILLPGGEYTPVRGEPLETHLERLAAIRDTFLESLRSMSLTDFRRLRPSDDAMASPEWVVQHLAQHEAEHRGQIWEARVAAEAALGRR